MLKSMTIQKGNPYAASISFTDKSVVPNTPYNLTDKTLKFTVKKREDSSSNDDRALIKKDWTIHTSPEGGETKLELTAEETNIPTGFYVGDFKIEGVCTSSFDINVVAVVTTR